MVLQTLEPFVLYLLSHFEEVVQLFVKFEVDREFGKMFDEARC